MSLDMYAHLDMYYLSICLWVGVISYLFGSSVTSGVLGLKVCSVVGGYNIAKLYAYLSACVCCMAPQLYLPRLSEVIRVCALC